MKLKLEITSGVGPLADDTFEVGLTATVTEEQQQQGNRGRGGNQATPVENKDVEFVVAGNPVGVATTGQDGKATQVVNFTSVAAPFVMAYGRLADDPAVTSPLLRLTLLRKEKEKEKESRKGIPTKLIVKPNRVDNTCMVFVRVTDDGDKGVPNAKIKIIQDSQMALVETDGFGEHSFSFTLQTNQEKEVIIATAGFGEKDFSHTFHWRAPIAEKSRRAMKIAILVLAIWTFLSLGIAIVKGGGEPLGKQALEKIAAEPEKSKIADYYYSSAKHFTGENYPAVAKPKTTNKPTESEPTWFWWKLFVASLGLLVALCLPLFLGWVRLIWRLGKEAMEQREIIVDLRPKEKEGVISQQTTTPTQPQQPPPNFVKRLWERFLAALTADAGWDLLESGFRVFMKKKH